jgi:hypothetical protein
MPNRAQQVETPLVDIVSHSRVCRGETAQRAVDAFECHGQHCVSDDKRLSSCSGFPAATPKRGSIVR